MQPRAEIATTAAAVRLIYLPSPMTGNTDYVLVSCRRLVPVCYVFLQRG